MVSQDCEAVDGFTGGPLYRTLGLAAMLASESLCVMWRLGLTVYVRGCYVTREDQMRNEILKDRIGLG